MNKIQKISIVIISLMNIFCKKVDDLEKLTDTSEEIPYERTFILEKDIGYIERCDIGLQNCENSEEKCSLIGVKGKIWEFIGCVNYGEHQLYEKCYIYDHFTSGIDSCNKGLFCMPNAPDDLEGICYSFCLDVNLKCPEKHHCEQLLGNLMPLCVKDWF